MDEFQGNFKASRAAQSMPEGDACICERETCGPATHCCCCCCLASLRDVRRLIIPKPGTLLLLRLCQVRRLIIEGKSNKAVVNHFTVINDNLTEFQVQPSFPPVGGVTLPSIALD